MKYMPLLTLEKVLDEFLAVDECLDDISAIVFECTHDVHTDTHDLELCVYGHGGIKAAPVVHIERLPLETIFPLLTPEKPELEALWVVFDDYLSAFIANRNISITWRTPMGKEINVKTSTRR